MYSEFGQERVDLPKELLDVLYVNRVEGQQAVRCAVAAKKDALDWRGEAYKAQDLFVVEKRRADRNKAATTVALVGVGVAFVGGVYVGSWAVR